MHPTVPRIIISIGDIIVSSHNAPTNGEHELNRLHLHAGAGGNDCWPYVGTAVAFRSFSLRWIRQSTSFFIGFKVVLSRCFTEIFLRRRTG